MRNRISLHGGSLVKRKYIKYVVAVLVIVALLAFVRNGLASRGTTSTEQVNKTNLKAAVANKSLDKEFRITLVGQDGEEIEGVAMRLENVELRDEIIVQGQKATSVAGRSFLIINLKLVNELTQAVEINTKDYLRLETGENEWLAPDIHNDPVLVQAISTKPTRVGFPVDANLRQFALQIGEITGEKEKVEIDFTQ